MAVLAYVFWHWPAAGPGAFKRDYEAALAAFHESLRAAAPLGLHASAAVRVDRAPFDPGSFDVPAAPRDIAAGGHGDADAGADLPVYEDWYLLDSSAALDVLDAAALGPACAAAHGAVARLAAGGTAGLYRLVDGEPDPGGATTGWWLSRSDPPGLAASVPALGAEARARAGSLWMRRMTLGPAPELCLLVPDGPPSAAAQEPAAVKQRRAPVA